MPQTTYTSGSVTFSELGAITIRSTTGQQFQFSVPQTSSLSATGNASLSVNASTISIGANAAAVSLSGNSTSAGAGYSNVSTGTLILAGGNNITLSQNGASVTISGANAGGAQTGISGVQVSDATYTSGTVTFQNANGISFGTSAGSAVTASHNAITTARASNDAIGLNTAQSNVTWTVNSSGLSLDARGYAGTGTSATNASITLNSNGLAISVAAGGGVNPVVSAANGSYSFTTLSFSNANGMSFGTSAGSAVTGSYTVPSVTQYFSNTATTFNGANISGSMTLNTNGLQLSMSVAAPGAAAENNAINLLGANTAGNTTATGSTIGWSGVNLTLSGTNNSQVVISAPATSSLVGFRGMTVSTAGSTISVGPTLASYFDNMNGEWPNSTILQPLQSTSAVADFLINDAISFGFIRIPMSASMAASTTAATTGNTQFSYGQTRTHNFVIYSRGTGASSLSLQSVASTSFTDQQSHNISANANSTQFSYSNRYTYYMSTGTTGFTYDYSSSAASLNYHTSGMTAITGVKMMEFPWATTLPPGQYWLMYGVSSSTASQFTNVGTRWYNVFSNYGMSQPNLAFGTIGAATNSSVGPYFGVGSFTTAGGGTTASLPISAVTTSGSHNKIFFAMANIA